MVIFICSVDSNYNRVILRKFGEDFTHGYFQNRLALISLRTFSSELIDETKIDRSLKNSLKFTNRFKNKNLVYVNVFDESAEEELFIEQLYSI